VQQAGAITAPQRQSAMQVAQRSLNLPDAGNLYASRPLENDMSEHLNDSGIAAVELIESPEQGITGNEIVARTGKAVHPHVIVRAAGKLRVIEDVVHLCAHIEGVPLAETEPLL
jgi:hypothetical protein